MPEHEQGSQERGARPARDGRQQARRGATQQRECCQSKQGDPDCEAEATRPGDKALSRQTKQGAEQDHQAAAGLDSVRASRGLGVGRGGLGARWALTASRGARMSRKGGEHAVLLKRTLYRKVCIQKKGAQACFTAAMIASMC